MFLAVTPAGRARRLWRGVFQTSQPRQCRAGWSLRCGAEDAPVRTQQIANGLQRAVVLGATPALAEGLICTPPKRRKRSESRMSEHRQDGPERIWNAQKKPASAGFFVVCESSVPRCRV